MLNFKNIFNSQEEYAKRFFKDYLTFEENFGKCYSLSYDFLLKNYKKDKELVLVHASMYMPHIPVFSELSLPKHKLLLNDLLESKPAFRKLFERATWKKFYKHALVENEEVVYDPVLQMAFKKEMFYQIFKVSNPKKYTPFEANKNSCKFYGFMYDWAHLKKDRTSLIELKNYPEEFIIWTWETLCKALPIEQDKFLTLSSKIDEIYHLKTKDFVHIKYWYNKYLKQNEKEANLD